MMLKEMMITAANDHMIFSVGTLAVGPVKNLVEFSPFQPSPAVPLKPRPGASPEPAPWMG